jgi:hypothetical protein
MPLAFQWSTARAASSLSVRPIISSTVRKPSLAMISRSSWAMNCMKLTTCSGFAGEFLAQLRVLGGNAHRAGVHVADAHHDAAQRHQRRGGKAELLGAQQRGDRHVAAGLELAVGLDHDAAAQVR